MCERNQRHVDPDHPADLRGEHAAGVDDELGRDLAFFGDERLHAAVLDLNAYDPSVFADFRAAASCTLDQGEGQLAGVDVTVGG